MVGEGIQAVGIQAEAGGIRAEVEDIPAEGSREDRGEVKKTDLKSRTTLSS
jgi:hypothetical protein